MADLDVFTACIVHALHFSNPTKKANMLLPSNTTIPPWYHRLESFEKRCPPEGEQVVVLYTTTLQAIHKSFEDCNTVRIMLEGLGV
ncbi:hypothetical protein IEQ34_021859 [Dendrobium chrysotoxum]|uniref:Uncharacterized protein n=1 Tax=Dendrobium chrysotoxum TaxID=161865 RepID=A0AAV7FW41_DENCH|nr:hypothetical protein IEQ34_021859 [Dendrobium chrysotoxum]